jgi:phage tail sheath protein FI
MAVTTSYPGVYIEELPSLTHSVQAASTSTAVFVGYTHPFLTKQTLAAVPLFSFRDYETNFGGFFYAPWQPDYVGQAVSQFFANGGQTCYVVGLPAQTYYQYTGTPPQESSAGSVAAANVTVPAQGGNIVFTALQPVGVTATSPATVTVGIPMQVAISNLQKTQTDNDTADIVISYGTTPPETYRKVVITGIGAVLQNSRLVSVEVPGTAPTAYPAPSTPAPGSSATGSPFSLGYGSLPSGAVAPASGFTVINPADFGQVFEDNAPLDKVPGFNLLITPGITDPAVTSEGVAYCERKRAFYIMDTPSPQTSGWDANSLVDTLAGGNEPSPAPPVSISAAAYYPWLLTADPVTGDTTDPVTGKPVAAPPSGFVAGIYAQVANSPGVWQSPAGIQTTILGTTGVDPSGIMTDPQQGVLNKNAIDCLRQFPGTGTVVFGARTTAGADANTAQQQWKYIAVRRMALFIEQSLYNSLTWAVFQPNDTALWNALTQEVSAFMLSLFRLGAFAGDTPSKAFVVQCDTTTTTPQDVANGVVNILVGFAPLVPAEFVVIQIAQLAGQAQS